MSEPKEIVKFIKDISHIYETDEKHVWCAYHKKTAKVMLFTYAPYTINKIQGRCGSCGMIVS